MHDSMVISGACLIWLGVRPNRDNSSHNPYGIVDTLGSKVHLVLFLMPK